MGKAVDKQSIIKAADSGDLISGATARTMLGNIKNRRNINVIKSKAVAVNDDVVDWLARGGTGDATLIAAYTQLSVDLEPIRVTGGKRLRLNLFADSAFANIFVPFLADLGPDTDTNNNFVAGDWGLTTGLQGNNATKFIDSGCNPSVDWLASNNGTMAFWNYTTGGALEFEMGCSISGAKYTGLAANVVGSTYHAIDINLWGILPVGTDTGFILATRNSDNDNKLYNGSTLVNTLNTVDISTPNENITVFKQPLGFFSGRRLGGYIIGDGLSAAEVTILYNALVTLNTALGR